MAVITTGLALLIGLAFFAREIFHVYKSNHFRDILIMYGQHIYDSSIGCHK